MDRLSRVSRKRRENPSRHVARNPSVECLKKGAGKSVACRGDLSMAVCCWFAYVYTRTAHA